MASQELSLALYGERLKTPQGQETHDMRLLAWISLRFEGDGTRGESPIRAAQITRRVEIINFVYRVCGVPRGNVDEGIPEEVEESVQQGADVARNTPT